MIHLKEERTAAKTFAQQAYIKSPLPPKPDKTKAEKLLVDILGAWYDEERRERGAE